MDTETSSQSNGSKGRFTPSHTRGFKPGRSGNPKGRPTGRTRLEQFIADLKADEKTLQEPEVRERFRILNEAYRWFDVVMSQAGFPDFIFKDSDGKLVRAEVQVNSYDFQARGHDTSACDLIICWRHNWGGCPLPVLTLSVEWANYLQLRQVRPWVF